jgi:low temperature requirement protein LtrA
MSDVEPAAPMTVAHRLRRMTGRDPHEEHRAATPLELLFDLTFVIAFGVSADQFAHLLVENHVGAGIAGFLFTTFAVSWAWINFTWFASAYDTDDWIFRLTTMLQMVGVIVFTMGIPPVYHSVAEGDHVDNRVMVAGYVVMRIAMVLQWLRAAGQDPERRRTCLTYAVAISVAQLGWIVAIFVDTSVPVTFAIYGALVLVECLGPLYAELRTGRTPWHADHLAERYGLLVIIALGEGVVGTVATLSAVVDNQGWSMDAALVTFAGVALTFGMWWVYFIFPAGRILHARKEKAPTMSFGFGYGCIAIFGAIVATGAGLHAAAYYIEHHSKLNSVDTVLTVAIPVAVYIVAIFAIYTYMVGSADPFHLLLITGSVAVLGIAILLAHLGVSMAVCLLVVTLAPVVVVVGYESVGHRHMAEALDRALSDNS